MSEKCRYRFADGRCCILGEGHTMGYHVPEGTGVNDLLVGVLRSSVSLRAGRKVGRTLYAQFGPEPADHDPLVGVMDTPELAAEVVRRWNAEINALMGRP